MRHVRTITSAKGTLWVPFRGASKKLLKLLSILCMLSFGLFTPIPQSIAASSWNPTLLVNTTTRQVIDDMSTADLSLQFGSTLNKNITYERTNSRFKFDAPVYIQGSLGVTGTMSGNALYVQRAFSGAGLTNCNNATNDKLLWSSTTQNFSCGTDQGGAGSGLSQSDADARYVRKSGSTMTGALQISNSAGLNASGTIITNTNITLNSDNNAADAVLTFGNATLAQTLKYVHANQRFEFSKDIRVTGGVTAVGALSGTTLTVSGTAGNTFVLDGNSVVFDATNNRFGIGTSSPETTLEVVGTASGLILHAQKQLRSSGSLVVENQSYLSGAVIMYEGTDPGTPSNDSLALYANSSDFDREMLRVKDADAVGYYLQPGLFGNYVTHVGPGSSATTLNSFGEGVTTSATLSQPTPTEAAPHATNFATSTTSGNESGFIGFSTPYFRGSTGGGNGFFFFARVMPVDTTSVRHFLGVTEQTSLANAMASDNIASDDSVQFQFSTVRSDTNWQFVTKNGTTQNVVNTGLAVTANKVYDMSFYCKPQCTTIYWKIQNKTDNTSAQGSTTSNLPTTTQAMRKFLGVETQTTAAKNLRMQSMYTEFKGVAN
jgi:hypothetical protein